MVIAALFSANPAIAGGCDGTMFNPITDIAWNSVWPLKVGGVTVKGNSAEPDSSDGTGTPVNFCMTSSGVMVGVDISFWNIGYLEEVVRKAWCSPFLGRDMATLNNGWYSGTTSKRVEAPGAFKQVHWIKFPVMAVMGMLQQGGGTCLARAGGTTGDTSIDYAMVTEVDPTHNDALLAAAVEPRAILFANPAADIACAASSLIAQVPGQVLAPVYDSLFWCWWDNIYPISGDKFSAHDLESAAHIGSKQIYRYYGTAMLGDNLMSPCKTTYTMQPKKSQWRFQFAKPVKSATAFPPGRSEFLMGPGMNPAYKDGNFLFVLFQKQRCLLRVYGSKQQ
jgi:conjugal transfer pilus assembly protein TraU